MAARSSSPLPQRIPGSTRCVPLITLERPALLTRAQQHQLHQWRDLRRLQPRDREDGVGRAVLRRRASSTGSRAPRSTRPATSAAPTSSSRPAQAKATLDTPGYPTGSTLQLPHRPCLGQPLHRQGHGADVPHPGRERHPLRPARRPPPPTARSRRADLQMTMTSASWGHSSGTSTNNDAAPIEPT